MEMSSGRNTKGLVIRITASGYFSPGAWANYTRHYPAGSYNVYCAPALQGGRATTCTLSQVTWRLAASTARTTILLGAFLRRKIQLWESFVDFLPLKDGAGNL